MVKIEKLGVIVGRFQTYWLTNGHKNLIKQVVEKSDKVLIIIGNTPTILTDNNPLLPTLRVEMLKLYIRSITTKVVYYKTLMDTPSDEDWSNNLDDLIDSYNGHIYNTTLYGGRDSFIRFYSGNYQTFDLGLLGSESATEYRNSIKSFESYFIRILTKVKYLSFICKFYEKKVTELLLSAFNAGVIYSSNITYPTSYQTVDVAVIKKSSTLDGYQIVLGKKPNTDKWCLIGGFVDVVDESLEISAIRELSEEVLNIITYDIKYILSKRINDWRYNNTKHGIMTSLFITYFLEDKGIKASDDLEKVEFFTFKEAKEVISEHHTELLDEVIKYETKQFNK